MAETLKYLYLIFSPADVLPLSEFVLSTEAHPLRPFAFDPALLDGSLEKTPAPTSAPTATPAATPSPSSASDSPLPVVAPAAQGAAALTGTAGAPPPASGPAPLAGTGRLPGTAGALHAPPT